MGITTPLRKAMRRTPARYLYHRLRAALGGAPQSDESQILARLAGPSCPRTFVEFGFHPTEYNCIGLRDFRGLLLDGDVETVRLARSLLTQRIEVRHRFVTLDNVTELGTHFPQLGVLSVDVDGNDYWFLEALLPCRPEVVVVEYNASFGLRPISVPYDPAFDRSAKHETGWYHGASLTALANLCRYHGYKLVAVSAAGGNAFFVPEAAAPLAVDAAEVYRESALRNRWSGTTASQQWERISHLAYVHCGSAVEEQENAVSLGMI
jgi:hypothetical protein